MKNVSSTTQPADNDLTAPIPEAPKRPTADDLANIKDDTRLAAYIVGTLILRHSVYFDLSKAGSEEANGLVGLIQDVRDALRQGLREVDPVEIRWLMDASAKHD